MPAAGVPAQEAGGVMSRGGASAGKLPRSLLFVPASEERKLVKALGSGADLLILDLEDSVAPDAKPAARDLAKGFLADHAGKPIRPLLYVRVNAFDTGLTADDIAVVLQQKPDGIMLPKANAGADAARLASMLDAGEQAAGLPHGGISIIVIATETPAGVLNLASFAGSTTRLKAMTWGAEDLGTAIGASASRDENGAFTGPFALARNLCLFGAHAAGVQAIDGIRADFRDDAGLEREAKEAARDGFTGKLAIHPAQVAAINAAFTPSPEEIAEAQAVIDAFAAQNNAGVIAIGGRMFDRPHLEKARRILARAR
jgi:citrate lyase subunit beta/citryl-CoA lyase